MKPVVQLLPGIAPEPLASYLAGLGLIRVLGEQADKKLTAAWTSDGLTITTTVEDIAQWLADEYVPTPVLSPWNNGSGFGAKDKEPLRVLTQLRGHPSLRLAQFRDTIDIARAVVVKAREHGWITDTAGGGDKRRVVQEFRNRCPDNLLPWIDAAVVLTGDDPVFPPLLGTGGNDGRLDFSTNFHQRLLDVIGTPRSAALARDLLAGLETEQLASAAIGQFDPASAGGPGSSKFGAADSLVNPWGYVLFVEGAMLFAASPVRRNQFAAGRAAIPFTVTPSAEGTGSGAAGEESRGEVWAPVWFREFPLPEIRQVFTEARASWRGRQARRATDFYAATKTLGVARGIDRFIRYGLQRRNGLAFAAVPLDRVEVRAKQQVVLAADLEDWPGRFTGSDTSAAVGQASRAFQRAHLEYVRDGEPRKLAEMLAALTSLEQAVGRSGRARDKTPVRRPPDATRFLAVLAEKPSPELRVAAGLASVAGVGPDGKYRSLRHLLLPIDQNRQWSTPPLIPGFGLRPLPAVLADVLIWRARTATAEDKREQFRGIPTFRRGVRVPAADLHAFAAGQLDPAELDLYLRACLALSWPATLRDYWKPLRRTPYVPVPTLGVLQPLATGLPVGEHRDDEPKQALHPDWPTRLIAGQIPGVHEEAVRRLRQFGWLAVPQPETGTRADGTRIAAALVARCDAPRLVMKKIAMNLKEGS
jgi:CRISPR-associated protein Csx17